MAVEHSKCPTCGGDVIIHTGREGTSHMIPVIEVLRDVAQSGVAFEDPRVGYIEVQIDRNTWEALATYRGRQP